MESTSTIEYLRPVDKLFEKTSFYTSKALFLQKPQNNWKYMSVLSQAE